MRLKKKVKVILSLAIILIMAGLIFLAYESFRPKDTKTANFEKKLVILKILKKKDIIF